MGGGLLIDEQPVHTVSVPSFWLAETPVTNAQYRAFVEATGHPAPPSWKDRRFNADEQPVVTVSWEDAQAFCRWAGLRLPSEAEWEYACRAGTTTEFWFGDDEERLADYGWFEGNSEGELQRVARKPANPFGLHDMHGNVWEWCQDRWHKDYKGAPEDGSAWEEGGSEYRVNRGGSFRSGAGIARSACRSLAHPESRRDDLGFRPAASDP
jgi:formylglycine-generating enzyme required for sulfatase activity